MADASNAFIKGTLATSLACAAGTTCYATYKRIPPTALAVQSGVNGAIVGATFFGIREYLVIPLLQSVASSETSMPSSEPSTVPTWSEIRTQNLRSTFLSGAATGGIWNSWKRGPPGMIPGMVTGALICTLVQLSYNELQVRRLMFLSSRLQELPPAISHTPSPAFDAGQAALPSASSSFSSPSPGKRSFWESTLDTLGKTGMFHRISNEEYLARLKIERDTALQRIEELEAQLAKDHSQSKPR